MLGESAISAFKIQLFDWFKATFLLVKAPFLFRFLIRSKGIPDPSAFNWPNYDLPTDTQKPPFLHVFFCYNHQSNSLLYSHYHILRISLQTPTCLICLHFWLFMQWILDILARSTESPMIFPRYHHELVGLSPHVTC